MRHGTRQLSGKRARHGAGHRRVAGFYSAAWPDIAPPLTRLAANPDPHLGLCPLRTGPFEAGVLEEERNSMNASKFTEAQKAFILNKEEIYRGRIPPLPANPEHSNQSKAVPPNLIQLLISAEFRFR